MAQVLYRHRIGTRVVFGSSAPCRNDLAEGVLLLKQPCFLSLVSALRNENIVKVLVLLSEGELRSRYIGGLSKSYKAVGLEVMRYPIPDFGVPPDMESFLELEQLLAELTEKERILVHCGAGIGRTGLVIAGLHVALGANARQALARVRKVRPGSVETEEQEEFIRRFAEKCLSIRSRNGV